MIKKLAFLTLFCAFLSANNLTWELPQVLSTPGLNATNARIGMDAAGNLVAAWIENNVILASTRPFGGAWAVTPTQISLPGATSLELVVDEAGNATAIWCQAGNIESATLPFSGAWSPPAILSDTGHMEVASAPQIAVDSVGNLAAVWQSNGVIQAVTKRLNKRWTRRPATLSPARLTSDSPQIAIGGNETIVAVWHSVKNGVDSVFSSATKLDTAWPSAPVLISDKGIFCKRPEVAVDSQGGAVAAWYRYEQSGADYSDVTVQAAFANPNGKWDPPSDISKPGMRNPDDLTVHVAFNQKDMACALWTNSYDASTFNLEGSAHDTKGWIPTVHIVNRNVYLYAQDFLISPFDYAYAIYMAYNLASGTPVIRSFKANTDNNKPNYGDILTVSHGGANLYPRIEGTTVDGTHATGAVWLNYDGSTTVVQASSGRGVALPAPTDLAVEQGSNNFGELTEYYNTLTWMSDSPDSTSNWVIFRNGHWLQTLPITLLKFVDENTVQNQPVTYGIALQSADGDMSPISTISFP